jgi:hypothetical protein
MPEKNAARIDHRRFEAGSRHEPHLSQTNDPQQGARLVRAFLRITDPRVREAVVEMVENVVGESPRMGLL